MAGVADITSDIRDNATVEEAQANVDALEQARSQLRGIQTGDIRSLFQYDKALGDRYSSPDSKMYIEHAGERARAVSGYSSAARGEINNLYDLMESVRSAKDDLQDLIDSLTKKSGGSGGSGGGGVSPSDILSMYQIDAANEPPEDLYDRYVRERGIILYKDDPETGKRDWKFAPAYSEVPSDYTVWKPTKTRISDVLEQTFGIDKETLSKLAALEAINPSLAKSTLNSLLSGSIKGTETKLTQQEIEAGVQPGEDVSVRNQKMAKYQESQTNPTYEDTLANVKAYKERGYTRDQYQALVAKANDGIIPPDVQRAIDEVYGAEGIVSKVIKGAKSVLTK